MENFDLIENSEFLIHSPVHLHSRTNTVLSLRKQEQKPVFKQEESLSSFLKFGQESFKSVIPTQNTLTYFPRLSKKSSSRAPLRDLLDKGTQAPNQWYINGQFYNREALHSYLKAEHYRKRLLFATDQTPDALNRQRFMYNRYKKNNYVRQRFMSETSNSNSLPSLIINYKVVKN